MQMVMWHILYLCHASGVWGPGTDIPDICSKKMAVASRRHFVAHVWHTWHYQNHTKIMHITHHKLLECTIWLRTYTNTCIYTRGKHPCWITDSQCSSLMVAGAGTLTPTNFSLTLGTAHHLNTASNKLVATDNILRIHWTRWCWKNYNRVLE